MSRPLSPLNELFSTLKGYINQLSAGDKTPGEVGSALNDWARDSAESIKSKIQEEVEASVSKMGFIKRDEFELLRERLEKIEGELLASGRESAKSSGAKSSGAKSSGESREPAKKSVTKKSAVKKRAVKVLKKSTASAKVKVEK